MDPRMKTDVLGVLSSPFASLSSSQDTMMKQPGKGQWELSPSCLAIILEKPNDSRPNRLSAPP